MNAITLVVDRLHIGYLGCYGNTWIQTPNFDRLAAEGFLLDQALIHSPDVARQYGSYAECEFTSAQHKDRAGLIAQLSAAGIPTTLITDDPAVADFAWGDELAEVIHVPAQRALQPATTIELTNLARFFAVAGEWLASAGAPFHLWLHCASLGIVWDAPLDMRQEYADEDDVASYDASAVPAQQLAPNYDPDELVAITQAYAGQVTLLDICLGALLADLELLPAGAQTMLSVLSARGFPLGEHRTVGAARHALHAELVHVPWIVRWPDGTGACDRSPALSAPTDLPPTLLDWFALPRNSSASDGGSLRALARGEATSWRQCVRIENSDGERAIRTPAWHLIAPQSGAAPHAHAPAAVALYAKPDDRWEINDVTNRCAEVVELLMSRVQGESADTNAEPLADILLAGLD